MNMLRNINLLPDGSVEIRNGAVIVCTLTPPEALLIGANAINVQARAIMQAMQSEPLPAPPSPLVTV